MSFSCGFLKECVMQLPRNAMLYQTVCKAIFHLLQLQFSRWHHYSNNSRCLHMLQPFLLTPDHTQVQSNILYSQISHMPEQYMITSQVNQVTCALRRGISYCCVRKLITTGITGRVEESMVSFLLHMCRLLHHCPAIFPSAKLCMTSE